MGAPVQYGSRLTAAFLPRFSPPGSVPNWQSHPLWDSHLVFYGGLMTKWRVPMILVVGLLLAADTPEAAVKNEKEKRVGTWKQAAASPIPCHQGNASWTTCQSCLSW